MCVVADERDVVLWGDLLMEPDSPSRALLPAVTIICPIKTSHSGLIQLHSG